MTCTILAGNPIGDAVSTATFPENSATSPLKFALGTSTSFAPTLSFPSQECAVSCVGTGCALPAWLQKTVNCKLYGNPGSTATSVIQLLVTPANVAGGIGTTVYIQAK